MPSCMLTAKARFINTSQLFPLGWMRHTLVSTSKFSIFSTSCSECLCESSLGGAPCLQSVDFLGSPQDPTNISPRRSAPCYQQHIALPMRSCNAPVLLVGHAKEKNTTNYSTEVYVCLYSLYTSIIQSSAAMNNSMLHGQSPLRESVPLSLDDTLHSVHLYQRRNR